jgi:hypothetical protein
MAGPNTFATIGNEAKGWAGILTDYQKRIDERSNNAATLAQRQKKLDFGNALQLVAEQRAQDMQKANLAQVERENNLRDLQDQRAAESHLYDVNESESARLDREMLNTAMGQIPIQYPEGMKYNQAMKLFSELGVAHLPEAQSVLNAILRPEQFAANVDLKRNIAATTEHGRNVRAATPRPKAGGSGKQNITGSLAGYLAEEKSLLEKINALGYTVPNTPKGNEVKSLNTTLTTVRKKIADLRAAQGAEIEANDPANQAQQADPMGLFN